MLAVWFATTNAYIFRVDNWDPFGTLNLSNLIIKASPTSNTGMELSGYKIRVKTENWQLNVHKICDEDGGNCIEIANIHNGVWWITANWTTWEYCLLNDDWNLNCNNSSLTTIIEGLIPEITDTNTREPNTKDTGGYVAAPGNNNTWKVRKVGNDGNPGWRPDATGDSTPYQLPIAANGTRWGIQIGYNENGKNYAVQLDGEKAYVYVPWESWEWVDATWSDGKRCKYQCGWITQLSFKRNCNDITECIKEQAAYTNDYKCDTNTTNQTCIDYANSIHEEHPDWIIEWNPQYWWNWDCQIVCFEEEPTGWWGWWSDYTEWDGISISSTNVISGKPNGVNQSGIVAGTTLLTQRQCRKTNGAGVPSWQSCGWGGDVYYTITGWTTIINTWTEINIYWWDNIYATWNTVNVYEWWGDSLWKTWTLNTTNLEVIIPNYPTSSGMYLAGKSGTWYTIRHPGYLKIQKEWLNLASSPVEFNAKWAKFGYVSIARDFSSFDSRTAGSASVTTMDWAWVSIAWQLIVWNTASNNYIYMFATWNAGANNRHYEIKANKELVVWVNSWSYIYFQSYTWNSSTYNYKNYRVWINTPEPKATLDINWSIRINANWNCFPPCDQSSAGAIIYLQGADTFYGCKSDWKRHAFNMSDTWIGEINNMTACVGQISPEIFEK